MKLPLALKSVTDSWLAEMMTSAVAVDRSVGKLGHPTGDAGQMPWVPCVSDIPAQESSQGVNSH